MRCRFFSFFPPWNSRSRKRRTQNVKHFGAQLEQGPELFPSEECWALTRFLLSSCISSPPPSSAWRRDLGRKANARQKMHSCLPALSQEVTVCGSRI